MTIRISVAGDRSSEQLLELYNMLRKDRSTVGSVEFAESAEKESLGSSLSTLLATVPPGAATAFAFTIVSYLRYKSSNLKITLQRPGGEQLTVEAKRLTKIEPEELADLISRFSREPEEPHGD